MMVRGRFGAAIMDGGDKSNTVWNPLPGQEGRMPGSRIAWLAMGIVAGAALARLASGRRREWSANARFSLGPMRADAAFGSVPVQGGRPRLPLS